MSLWSSRKVADLDLPLEREIDYDKLEAGAPVKPYHCKRCEGSGRIALRIYPRGWYEKNCPRCKGRGVIGRERKGDWFQTFTGRVFWPMDPEPEDVYIEDIAQGLSLQCRFNGQVRVFYSVAQHSIIVMENLPRELQPFGLMHDAGEAYIGDMIRPLKISMPEFKAVEKLVDQAIAIKYGLVWDEDIEHVVKGADNIALMTERRDLLAPPPVPWTKRAEPMKAKIKPWTAHDARDRFLKEFLRLFVLDEDGLYRPRYVD